MANALDSDSKDREFESLRADHVVASYISLAATFFLYLIRKSPRTHSTAPPLRNESRSSRLLGCKRPRNGLVSLPTRFSQINIVKRKLHIACGDIKCKKPCVCKAFLLSLFNFMNYCISCNAYNTADYIKNYIINIKCTGCKNILQHFNYYRN